MRRTDVVIVGGGPAGITAGIWCKRLGLASLLLEARSQLGGQLRLVYGPIIDYPGIPAANGAEMQARFIAHAEEAGGEIIAGAEVTAIDAASKRVAFRTSAGGSEEVEARALVLAMGACDRRLAVPGEAEMLSRGEVYSASRDRDRFAGRPVAVVGGGDRAVENALLLAERGVDVTLIHRSDRFRARREFTEPAFAHPRIRVVNSAQVTAIHGDERVRGVTVTQRGGDALQLAADAVLVRIGVEPNSRLVRGELAADDRGFLFTDREGRTNASGVYAVGDLCTTPDYSSLSSAVGQAMIAAKAIYLDLQGE